MGRRRARQKTQHTLSGAPNPTNKAARPDAFGLRGISVAGVVSAAALAIAWIAHASRPGPAFPNGVAGYWLRAGLGVAAFTALASLIPFRVVRELPHICGALLRRPSPKVFAALVALATTSFGVVFALYAFDGFPTTSDEFAQLWHAKILAHGRLSLPADPNPEFFAIDNVIDTGRWYSQFPIGGPMVLVPGVWLGVPWLINPVLAGIAAAAMYVFARHAFGETQGRAAAALFSVTPMVSNMAGSMMNHVATLCFALCSLAALAEWHRAKTRRRSLVCASIVGLLLGAMATVRPLDAVATAAAIGAFQLVVVFSDRARWADLAVQASSGMIGVVPLLYANWATNGNAFRFGYEVLWGSAHRVGFHADPQGGVHTLARGVEYATSYISQLNMFVWMWPVPALVVVCAALVLMARATKWDALLLGLFGAQVAAYAAYWYQGQFLGPRFLFTALPTLIVFVARAPSFVAQRWTGYAPRAALVFVLACLVVSWTAPSTPFAVQDMARRVRDNRRALKVDLAAIVRDAGVDRALVFIREPFSTRVLHRMWAAGVSRSDAAQLLARSDACSLLSAVRSAEGDTTASASVTAECEREIADDARLGGGAFGPALPLEPIDADGRVSGDIVYVADLGERNEVLRARFGDRPWYRLTIVRPGARDVRPVLEAYVKAAESRKP